MRVRDGRGRTHLVIVRRRVRQRRDAHERAVAVGALALAAAPLGERGPRRVADVERVAVGRVGALVQPRLEAPPHVADVHAPAHADAVAQGEHQGRVIGERAGQLPVRPARRHARALERPAALKLVGNAQRVTHRRAVHGIAQREERRPHARGDVALADQLAALAPPHDRIRKRHSLARLLHDDVGLRPDRLVVAIRAELERVLVLRELAHPRIVPQRHLDSLLERNHLVHLRASDSINPIDTARRTTGHAPAVPARTSSLSLTVADYIGSYSLGVHDMGHGIA